MLTSDQQAVTEPGPDGAAAEYIEVTVSDVERVAADVVALTLRPRHGSQLPEWAPGAHIDVNLGPDLVRQYSLCGEPGDRSSWRIAVLREPRSRDGSATMHTLRPGDQLSLSRPRNRFTLDAAANYLFIAGGIGITPILPMVRAAARSGTPWQLFYGGRDRDSMAFTEELVWHGERVTLYPQDESGLLDLDTMLAESSADTLVYCCGPEGLLTAVAARTAHWPYGSVRMERFNAVDAGAADGDAPFEVECRASGVNVTVSPDESILDAVERAGGVVVASSCREGVCGTCETTVLEGTPEHRDAVLNEEERTAGDVMMTCVSRARTARLVLDM